MTEVGPDAAAELRLIRSEITAIRQQVIREQEARERAHVPPPRPPGVHLALPVRRYRLRTWIAHRSKAGALPRSHVSRQRRLALWLTVFAAIRTAAWLLAMVAIIVHWLGAGGPFLHAFTALASTVVFVTFISFYCNAVSDLANFTAGLAALFSADSHAAVITGAVSIGADFEAMEADIARLADLQPGEEATELAGAIRRRLQAEPGRA